MFKHHDVTRFSDEPLTTPADAQPNPPAAPFLFRTLTIAMIRAAIHATDPDKTLPAEEAGVARNAQLNNERRFGPT